MNYNSQRSIFLVTSPGEKTKAFGTQALALEYKHNFCDSHSTKIEQVTLFERTVGTKPSGGYDDDDSGYGGSSRGRHYDLGDDDT